MPDNYVAIRKFHPIERWTDEPTSPTGHIHVFSFSSPPLEVAKAIGLHPKLMETVGTWDDKGSIHLGVPLTFAGAHGGLEPGDVHPPYTCELWLYTAPPPWYITAIQKLKLFLHL